jgi:hypothetical protein
MAIVADRGEAGGGADVRIENMALATHPIATAERTRRARVYEEALASVRLEGFDLDEQVKALYRRYIDGELTLAEVGREIDELDDREFGPVSLSRHKRPQEPPPSLNQRCTRPWKNSRLRTTSSISMPRCLPDGPLIIWVR